MSPDYTELEREHWHYSRNGVATWDFDLEAAVGEPSQHALRRHALAALRAVAPLAAVRRIEWVTKSAGDDAAVLEPAGDIDPDAVHAVFDRLDDVDQLHVDLHSPMTFGTVRDNRVLAAINGPRLTGFLRFIRDRMGAKVNQIEADSYKDLVTDEGFRLS